MKEVYVSDYVESREKMIDFISSGNFEGDNGAGELWDRYAFSIYQKDKCVTTRISKQNGQFFIDIIIQHDHYYKKYSPYPYSEGNWEDVGERVTFLKGDLNDIHVIITEDKYENLLLEMNTMLEMTIEG